MHAYHQYADNHSAVDHCLVHRLCILEAHAADSSLRKSEYSHTYKHPERNECSRSQCCDLGSVFSFAHEIPSRIACIECSDDVVHAAALSDHEEQKQKCAACHDESLDRVSRYDRLESAYGCIDDDDCSEQQQSRPVRESCDCLEKSCAADELSDHLCGEEDHHRNTAYNDNCRRVITCSEIVVYCY